MAGCTSYLYEDSAQGRSFLLGEQATKGRPIVFAVDRYHGDVIAGIDARNAKRFANLYRLRRPEGRFVGERLAPNKELKRKCIDKHVKVTRDYLICIYLK